ncbi:MAG TPA: transcription termination/antitermination NusG family protein [Pyrinomonadaceae bacterium]|jgi:transcriptional antiterminator RfaH
MMSYVGIDDSARWYAIRTHPKQEGRAESNLRAWQVETFYPRIKEGQSHPYLGTITYVAKALFPRYIFARFDANQLLRKVWFTRGVHSVIGFGSGPSPIDDEIIGFIQSQIKEDGFIRIGSELREGDKVRIKDGPLKSLVGIFERALKGSMRVMVLLETVNYQGHLVVERQQISKINP